MKNRNSVLLQLDKIDGIVTQLNFIVKTQQPIEQYMETLEKLKEIVDQTRLYIESEPQMYNN